MTRHSATAASVRQPDPVLSIGIDLIVLGLLAAGFFLPRLV